MHIKSALQSLLLLASATVTVSAGQIPSVNGVIGGVPENVAHKTSFKAVEEPSKLATTPGKLRIVENSGLCGMTY
jgi:hypothetical protein